ncbi:zeta toxin family protein [Rhodopirellula europaea]|uniref:zeta toxin family protein n=1 Tax=Rhodopirellula europaea TaxID=1263866 RepID=UPI003D2D3383|tara:strand:- start:4978 stop:5580 length:603 start_codon:yes stop_codon:yes gene_type:complete
MVSNDSDKVPTLIVLAGSNGAGKSTFYETHLASFGWPFVNADALSKDLGIDAYAAAEVARQQRCDLIRQRTSFVFETVLSDPVGEKIGFLEECSQDGFNVILAFVAIRDAEMSIQRVGMRVSQGGHAVPMEKLRARHSRTLANLKRVIRRLPQVRIYDNSDLSKPYEHVATFLNGQPQFGLGMLSDWLQQHLVSEFYPDA